MTHALRRNTRPATSLRAPKDKRLNKHKIIHNTRPRSLNVTLLYRDMRTSSLIGMSEKNVRVD